MAKDEDQLVAWIRDRFSSALEKPEHAAGAPLTERSDGPVIGIGDDMAMVAIGGGRILVAADMLMDGVHFETSIHRPSQIGRKAMAASLSDCAAMAVRPCWALVSVALPEVWSMEQARSLYGGMEALSRCYHCPVVGGDTNSWSGPLVIDVSVVAEPYAGVAPVRRGGVRPGDEVFVTGRLGGSLRGHHLCFEPRVEEAHRLAKRLGTSLHAMMDLSDGISVDAARMAAESGCGLIFEMERLERVIANAARSMAKESGRTPLAHALHDGEDFELLFAVERGTMSPASGAEGGQAAEAALDDVPLTRIGEAVAAPGVWLAAPDGSRRPLKREGWRHFT